MADREGQVTMADRPVKSLVSEQYLDGWSYGDEEDSDESESPAPPSGNKQQTNPVPVPGYQNKRPHSKAEENSDDGRPVEKKKFCMSLGSKPSSHPPTPLAHAPPLLTQALPSAPSSGKLSMNVGAAPSSKKISMNVGQSAAKLKAAPIKMSLSAQSKPKPKETVVAVKTNALAQAFGDDSDESEEEMPAEARMRMRNIGRETPTAAGPNSFGKSRLGFCDRQKIIERELQKNADD